MVYTYNETLFNLTKKKILTHVTTWMNLEDITQSERKRSQKDKYHMIPLIQGAKSNQIHRVKKSDW